MPVQESQPPLAPGQAPPDALLEFRQPFPEKVEGDAAFTAITRRALGQLDGRPRNGQFRGLRLSSRLFDDLPASVAGRKVALGMNAGWILTENGLHAAY